jgi:hypothetical protein
MRLLGIDLVGTDAPGAELGDDTLDAVGIDVGDDQARAFLVQVAAEVVADVARALDGDDLPLERISESLP